jgi:hypothetical protein
MVKAKVGRSVKTMQVIKKFMYQYKSLLQHCLPICIKADFQQRIVEKYRRSLSHGLALPNLYFLRDSRYVNILNQEMLTTSPAYIAVTMPVLKSQYTFRETIQREKIIYVQTKTGKSRAIPNTLTESWSISSIKSHQNLIMEKLSSIEWHNIRRPLLLSVHEDLFIRSVLNFKKTQIIPVAITVDQNISRPSFSKMEILPERFDKSNGHVHIQKVGGPPAVRQDEDSVIIHKAGRPLELSYLPTAATPLAKPVFHSGRQKSDSTFSERPQVDIHPPPQPSHAGSLDLNLLTDQVYQVLERKIRLEKQRRGYR